MLEHLAHVDELKLSVAKRYALRRALNKSRLNTATFCRISGNGNMPVPVLQPDRIATMGIDLNNKSSFSGTDVQYGSSFKVRYKG